MDGSIDSAESEELQSLLAKEENPEVFEFLQVEAQEQQVSLNNITQRVLSEISEEEKQTADAPPVVPIQGHSRNRTIYWGVAAAVVLLVVAGIVFYPFAPNDETVQMEEISPAPSKTGLDVLLADGTAVKLKEKSTLYYPNEFGAEFRKVNLKGSAYFDVAKMEERPFQIRTSDFVIQVVGTKFMVNQFQDSLVVDVTEGEIRVASIMDPELTHSLKSGMRGRFFNEKFAATSTTLQNEVIQEYLFKELQFEDAPLELVFNKVGEVYGVEFTFLDPTIQDFRVTGDFSSSKLPTVLKVLEMTHDLHFEQNEGVITVGN